MDGQSSNFRARWRMDSFGSSSRLRSATAIDSLVHMREWRLCGAYYQLECANTLFELIFRMDDYIYTEMDVAVNLANWNTIFELNLQNLQALFRLILF